MKVCLRRRAGNVLCRAGKIHRIGIVTIERQQMWQIGIIMFVRNCVAVATMRVVLCVFAMPCMKVQMGPRIVGCVCCALTRMSVSSHG